jgi:arginyl-tRNA synthetase
VRLGKTI